MSMVIEIVVVELFLQFNKDFAEEPDSDSE
jgi:hypothetical protein